MNKKLAVVGLAVGIAVGSGVAAASIPSAGGAIQGCYTNKNLLNGTLNASGTLRVIDAATETCRSNETPISWNQAGTQGPVGPQGAQGPQGVQGPAGAAAPRYFAVVAANGSITNSSGVNASPSVTYHSSTGSYTVAFNQPVANCALAITVRNPLGIITPVMAKGGTSSQTQVTISVMRPDGVFVDAPFDLTVTC